MKQILSFFLLIFLVNSSPEPTDLERGNNQQIQQQNRTNTRKVLAQGCLIGGVIVIVAGLGLGVGLSIDHSNSSINQDVDIDLDCEYPVIILEPTVTPAT
jgi:hypothetical protein